MIESLTDKEIIIAIIGLVYLAIQSYSAYKQRQLDIRAKETNDSLQENNNLLRKNTEMTEELAKQTNGITDRLLSVVKTTGYAVGRLRSAEGLEDENARDALEALEREFEKSRKSTEK